MNVKAASVCASVLALGCQRSGGSGEDPDIERPGASDKDPERSATLEPRDVRPAAFAEVAEAAGIVGDQQRGIETCNSFAGSGSAWGDVELDGDVDLFATNHGGPNFLYLNDGDRTGDGLTDFVEVAAAFGLQQSDRRSHAAVFVDHDNDGDQDLYVTHLGGNTLWRNRLLEGGALAFEDVTAFAGVADEGRAITSAWGDLDRDGFLDFYLAKHASCFENPTEAPPDRLFHARGDGAYEDWSRFLCDGSSTTCRDVTGLGFTAAFLDHDDDGDADIYLVNDATHGGGPNRHWRNDGPDGSGGWLLTEVSDELGTDTRLNGMGLAVGDIDNDGWLDLAFSNIGEAHVLHNRGDGSYEDITYTCGIFEATALHVSWGTVFLDADCDGWLDVFLANGPIWGGFPDADTFLLNDRDLTFTDLSLASGVNGDRKGRNVSLADFDADGRVDLFVGNFGQQPYLYRNRARELGSTQHWLVVTAQGTVSNRDAIGTRLTLQARGLRQIREITSGAAHGGGDEKAAFFGLGQNAYAFLEVRWPTGVVQELGLVLADQRLHLVEPLPLRGAEPVARRGAIAPR